MYYMINGKFINESGSLSCCVPQKNGKLPGLVKKKQNQTTQSDTAVTANLSLFCLRKKQKASLTVFFPQMSAVCVSLTGISYSLLHSQCTYNCKITVLMGGIVMTKSVICIPILMSYRLSKRKKKKKTNTKDSYTRNFFYFSLRNQWCIAPKDLYVAVF